MTKRGVELFCGTKSFSRAAVHFGINFVTVDINKLTNPDICKDILNLSASELPQRPFIVWASPPCTEYSKAKSRGARDIEGANLIVLKTLELIRELDPVWWVLENPQTGKLKEQPFMEGLPFVDVDYCQYGYPYRKRTRLWTNIPIELRKCPGPGGCPMMVGRRHISSAGNGRKHYTDRVVSLQDKYSIPPELCVAILEFIS